MRTAVIVPLEALYPSFLQHPWRWRRFNFSWWNQSVYCMLKRSISFSCGEINYFRMLSITSLLVLAVKNEFPIMTKRYWIFYMEHYSEILKIFVHPIIPNSLWGGGKQNVYFNMLSFFWKIYSLLLKIMCFCAPMEARRRCQIPLAKVTKQLQVLPCG